MLQHINPVMVALEEALTTKVVKVEVMEVMVGTILQVVDYTKV